MNTKRQQDVNKLTILYERLSVEDERNTESDSITNQKAMLEDYAQKNGFRNIVHMTDDGVSGTRFDRPSFVKMMDEVAAGNVGTVIVKDLSR
jgi:DNA invertase Pin-like site-specific DNA recombinase